MANSSRVTLWRRFRTVLHCLSFGEPLLFSRAGEMAFTGAENPNSHHKPRRARIVNLTGQNCEIRQKMAGTTPPLFATAFFKLQFRAGVVSVITVSPGGDPSRRKRATFGHVSAHGSLVTFTHVISAGNCTSAESQSESAGFPFPRRHSSAGILALKWATARSSSFGSSLASENRGSKDSIRSIVVTPDSIPQFTIPKLALENGFRARVNEKERQGEEDEDWGSIDNVSGSYHSRLSLSSSVSSSSSSSGFGVSPVPGRKAISDVKRAQTQSNCSLVDAEHCSDHASRAALSLPHLPKVTTPYGFVTLSKSPQMANEEALFFQGHRRWGDEEINPSRHPKLEMKRSITVRTSPIQTHAGTPPHQSPIAHQFFRSHSVTGIEIEKQLAQSYESVKQVSKSKRSLWGILRKADRKSFDFNSNLK